MRGKLLRDWLQTSLILSLALSLIVGEELAFYVMLVDWTTLKYNSFRWRSIRMFNRLAKPIRMLSSSSDVGFKSQLDSYLRNIGDLPCQPGFNNSLDGGDCLHGGHYANPVLHQRTCGSRVSEC